MTARPKRQTKPIAKPPIERRRAVAPPVNEGLVARIEEALPKLRASEARVARLVLSKTNTVIRMSIAAVAEACGVSQPTVARFCSAIGCGGFKDFKLKLAQSLASGVPFVHSDVNLSDAAPDISAKVFNRSIAALLRTRNELDAAAVEKAIALLAHARRIEFYGLGNSGIVAQDAQHKFFRLGVPTVAYADPHVHGMAATMLNPGDVVLAISSSGRTLDLLRSVNLARAAGATIIAITAPGSPLARAADCALVAEWGEDPDVYSPMTSRLVQLAIIDVLAVGVALVRGPKLVAQLERTKHILREKRARDHE